MSVNDIGIMQLMTADRIRNRPLYHVYDIAFLLRELTAQLAEQNATSRQHALLQAAAMIVAPYLAGCNPSNTDPARTVQKEMREFALEQARALMTMLETGDDK